MHNPAAFALVVSELLEELPLDTHHTGLTFNNMYIEISKIAQFLSGYNYFSLIINMINSR